MFSTWRLRIMWAATKPDAQTHDLRRRLAFGAPVHGGCARANSGGVNQIRKWAASVTLPRLVIVDVLAMFKPVRDERDSMYDADYGSIKSLQALAAKLGIAIILISSLICLHSRGIFE